MSTTIHFCFFLFVFLSCNQIIQRDQAKYVSNFIFTFWIDYVCRLLYENCCKNARNFFFRFKLLKWKKEAEYLRPRSQRRFELENRYIYHFKNYIISFCFYVVFFVFIAKANATEFRFIFYLCFVRAKTFLTAIYIQQ